MDPLEPLRRSLAKPVPLYVLFGGESLYVKAAEEEVQKAVCNGPMTAMNHHVFTAGEEGALRFGDAAATVPMMAPWRLVVIRQVQDANVALLEQLLAYCQAPVPSTVLVVTGEKFPAASGGVDRGLRFQNAAKKVGMVLKLDGEGIDPVRFVEERAKGAGVSIRPEAARCLVELVGDDLSLLAGEVEKLGSYAGEGGVIDRAAVEDLVKSTAETEVWALTNALVARDRDRALAASHRLLEDGEPPHRLLASVLWQVRQMLVLQDLKKRGINEREANIRINPMVARSMGAMLAKPKLLSPVLLDEIALANRKMNSSRAGDRRIFEGLVMRLTEM